MSEGFDKPRPPQLSSGRRLLPWARGAGALVLLVGVPSACGPGLRPVGSAGAAHSTRERSADEASSGEPALASEAQRRESPPGPLVSAPPVPAPRIVSLPGGPVVCIAERPDWPRTFSELLLPETLGAEESFLTAAWLKQAWSDQTAPGALPLCAGRSLCIGLTAAASTPSPSAAPLEQQSGRDAHPASPLMVLLDRLVQPPASDFYSARLSSLDSLERHRDRLSPWMLTAAAEAAASGDPTVGKPVALGIGYPALAKTWTKRLASVRWVIAGPEDGTRLERAVRAHWAAIAPQGQTGPESPEPGVARLTPSSGKPTPTTLVVDEDLGERARLVVVLPPQAGDLWTRRVIVQWLAQGVEPAAGLYSQVSEISRSIVLELEGPLEPLLEVHGRFHELASSAEQWGSGDWAGAIAAARRSALTHALDPRCFADTTRFGTADVPFDPSAEPKLTEQLKAEWQAATPVFVLVGSAKLLRPALRGQVRSLTERGGGWALGTPQVFDAPPAGDHP